MMVTDIRDVQTFSNDHFLEFKLPQNGYYHKNLKIDAVYDHN